MSATAAAAVVVVIAAAGEKEDGDNDDPDGVVVKNVAKAAIVIHSIRPFVASVTLFWRVIQPACRAACSLFIYYESAEILLQFFKLQVSDLDECLCRKLAVGGNVL